MTLRTGFFYIMVALAATSLSLVGCGGGGKTSEDQSGPKLRAAVTFAKGNVTVHREGQSKALTMDSVLDQGDEIRTGANGAVDLLVEGLGAVKLGENTNVRLLNLTKSMDATRAEVAVDQGQMASFVNKRRKSDSFQVVTPTAIAGVRGTVFLTRVEPQKGKRPTRVRLSVFSGKVAMRIPGQPEEIILDRNSQMEIEGLQRLNRKMVRTLSPEALKEIKRLTVNHKSNSLEFNRLVEELEQSNPALARTAGGDASTEITARKRRMDRERMANDTVARARRARDSSVLKREVDPDHIKLKPKAGYRQ